MASWDDVRRLALALPETIADNPAVFFTIPHFNGYPAVLIRLDQIDVDELAAVVTEAWLLLAPKRLAADWAAEHGQTD